jgi:ribosomal protein L29
MKTRELKSKSQEELKSLLSELKKELIKLNTQVATGTTLKSPGLLRNIKKNIARIMAELKAK